MNKNDEKFAAWSKSLMAMVLKSYENNERHHKMLNEWLIDRLTYRPETQKEKSADV